MWLATPPIPAVERPRNKVSTHLDYAISSSGLDSADVMPLVEGDDSVLVASCPGASAVEVWSDIRAGSERHGFWPVLLGSKESYDAHRELADSKEGDDPAMAILKAASIDVLKYFSERLAEIREYAELPRTEWLAAPKTSNELTIHKDIRSMQPLTQVFIGLLATREPWAAPALLRFGGWNDCPFPEQHVAAFIGGAPTLRVVRRNRVTRSLRCSTHDRKSAGHRSCR